MKLKHCIRHLLIFITVLFLIYNNINISDIFNDDLKQIIYLFVKNIISYSILFILIKYKKYFYQIMIIFAILIIIICLFYINLYCITYNYNNYKKINEINIINCNTECIGFNIINNNVKEVEVFCNNVLTDKLINFECNNCILYKDCNCYGNIWHKYNYSIKSNECIFYTLKDFISEGFINIGFIFTIHIFLIPSIFGLIHAIKY